MAPKARNEGMCVVRDCGDPQKIKGLCSTHYPQHIKGKADYTQAIAGWELSQAHSGVCGYWAYKERLKTILRGVDVSRAQRSAFNKALLDAYADANPVEFARAMK